MTEHPVHPQSASSTMPAAWQERLVSMIDGNALLLLLLGLLSLGADLCSAAGGRMR